MSECERGRALPPRICPPTLATTRRAATADRPRAARGRPLDRAVARRPGPPHLPGGRIRAERCLRDARRACVPRARGSGLAVTLTGRLLAGRLAGIATPAVRGNPARRTI